MIEHSVTPTLYEMVVLCKRLTEAVDRLSKERDGLKEIIAGEEERHKKAYNQLDSLARIVVLQDEELLQLRHRK